jgi:hypothetical protein
LNELLGQMALGVEAYLKSEGLRITSFGVGWSASCTDKDGNAVEINPMDMRRPKPWSKKRKRRS